MDHAGIMAALQDLQVVDSWRDEALPALTQQFRRFPGTAGDHRERDFVFRDARRDGLLRRLCHGDRDFAGLAHHLDFQVVLDRALGAEQGRDVREVPGCLYLARQICRNQRRETCSFHAQPARTMMPQPTVEQSTPLASDAVFPRPHGGDRGHARGHLGFHERGEKLSTLVSRDKEQGRAAEIDSQIAPDAGQVADVVGIGDNSQIDIGFPHPRLEGL